MKTIEVKVDRYAYPVYLNEDGEFRCPHENVEIEAPCCSGRDKYGNVDCGCYGSYSVYCPDCHNDDMEQHEVDSIVENYLDYEPDYDEDY